MSRNNEPSTHRQRHHQRDDGEAMSVLGGKAEDICSSGAFQLLTRNGPPSNRPHHVLNWSEAKERSYVVLDNGRFRPL